MIVPSVQNRFLLPTLWICRPETAEDITHFDSGTAAVYDQHTLLRTWLALHQREEIILPDAIEPLVELVYAVSTCQASHSEAMHWLGSKAVIPKGERPPDSVAV